MTQQEREQRFDELKKQVAGHYDIVLPPEVFKFIQQEIDLAVKAREEEIVQIINEWTPKKDFTSYGINRITMTLDDYKRNHAREILSLISKPTWIKKN